MGELDASKGVPATTPRASLAVIAATLREKQVFEPIHQQVRIAQKTVRYSPTDKLYQAFAGLLTGACGIVEVNERLRADVALQQAFGLNGCAEQSVIQETLDACSEANVAEIHRALGTIYQTHSQAFRHDYDQAFLLLDLDLTGQPCGRKAEFATKGYFAHQRNRRGRQVGRVVASRYHEIVCDRLYPGNVVLHSTLPDLLHDAETILGLDAAKRKRKRTILRIDAGGGSVEDINRALVMGYQIHVKDCSTTRAERLAESVTDWIVDPHDSTRQLGFVTEPSRYIRPVTRIAARHQTEKGEWKAAVIVSTLTRREVIEEAHLPEELRSHPQAALLA